MTGGTASHKQVPFPRRTPRGQVELQILISWLADQNVHGSLAPWLQKQPSPPTSGDKVKVKVRGRGSM